MTEYEFTLILQGTDASSPDAEVLYAICNDGTLSRIGGVTRFTVGREAPSLNAAVRSAIADVRRAGFEVERVETSPQAWEAVS